MFADGVVLLRVAKGLRQRKDEPGLTSGMVLERSTQLG